MTVTIPCLCTREDVKGALDVAETARANDRVDRAIEAATQAIEGTLGRSFTPWTGTKYFPWPDRLYGSPWVLWLGADDLVSVTSIVDGGTTIPATNYYLEPQDLGPPYNRIEINLASSSAWAGASSMQRSIAVTGTFGFGADETSVGALGSNLGASATATATITWTPPTVGVGSLLRVDDERMLVVDRTMSNSAQTLQGALTAQASNVAVLVTDGTAFAPGEILLVDSERMLVVDIAGNTLTVKRAWDGSVLATHSSSAAIWTLTGVTLARAKSGTALAAHTTSATVYRHVVPPLIRDFAIALAVNQLLQESAGYARTAGSGDNLREVSGRGLRTIEQDAMAAFGRQFRKRAI